MRALVPRKAAPAPRSGHNAVRHPRPGGGDDPRPTRRRVERRQARAAGGRAGTCCTTALPTPSWPSFIGSPSMNLRPRHASTTTASLLGDQRAAVPAPHHLPRRRRRRHPPRGARAGERPHGRRARTARVVLSEMLGSDVLLHLEAPDLLGPDRRHARHRTTTSSTTRRASSPASRRPSAPALASASACAWTCPACTSSTRRLRR